MKVKLLRKAWKNLRIVKLDENEYSVQTYEREYGWTELRRGTLAEMLAYRHSKIRKYIGNHPELYEDRIKVIC